MFSTIFRPRKNRKTFSSHHSKTRIVGFLTFFLGLITGRIRKIRGNPPPADLVGYETLLRFMILNNTLSVDGDLVEIGTFLGGGAYKLSKFLKKNNCPKKIYVIDVFDPDFDLTKNVAGLSMSSLYKDYVRRYGKKSQRQVFFETIEGLDNIVVLEGDSAQAEIPGKSICFGFIDGNHDPKYVESDFYLVWNKLSSKGVIAFHDYEFDLPQVTKKIGDLAARHAQEIEALDHDKEKHILFIIKK